ncbi:MAG: ABC transporter substrate-binding protein [Spirochaetota bacterium]|nr:ABC transporter substrate-binding protein [Spirochaetota bacterium]
MIKKTKLIPVLILTVLFLVTVFTGCKGEKEADTVDQQKKGPIVVASKIDTEGALLGNMILQLLEHHGFETVDQVQFGTTDVIRKAIQAGEIDMYPEYTGNAAFFHNDADNPVWKNPEEAWQRAAQLDREAHDLIWLASAPANNTWAIALRQDLSEKENILTLEDFSEYVNSGGAIKLACSEEFASRQGALPSFEEAYGFKLEKNQLLILSGGNTATTEKAAAEQTDGVNAAMAYGTDGALAALGLVVLEDNRNVQHVYEPAPLVRAEVLEAYPEIREILDPVMKTLGLTELQTLNSKIAVMGEAAGNVAKKYLEDNNFIE